MTRAPSELHIPTGGQHLVLPLSLSTTDSVTEWFPAGLYNRLTSQLVSTTDPTTAVVDLQWTLDPEQYEKASAFSPAVQMTSSNSWLLHGESVTNRGWLRFKTSTAEANIDSQAIIVVRLK